MKVIHIVHGRANPNEHNGISRVVYFLNKNEKLQGIDSRIWAVVDGCRQPYSHRRDEHVTVECFPRVWLPWGRHPIVEALLRDCESIDLVHFHLIWFYDKNIIADALTRAGVPFVITAHGTYSTLHAYTGKRRLARWLYELKYLRQAAEIHTLTREEGWGLHRYGYVGRSFVVPNGIEPSEIPVQRSNRFFVEKPYRDKAVFLWVGVLRDDKNLMSLIRAVALLPTELREQFTCVLVGPDYRGNARRYLDLAESLGCRATFDHVGPLYGQAKYDAIHSADALVMPSVSEGFSMAILDAMALSKPCLVTNGCGLSHYLEWDAFVRCEPYPQDLARGLEELLHRRGDWPAMGHRAAELVAQRLTWPSITKEMIRNYGRIASAARAARHKGSES